MKTKNVIITTVILSMLLIAATESVSAGNKVYFYEAKTTGNYKISMDYSVLKDRLKESGYEVSELRTGLTREALNTLKADVLVVSNLGTELTPAEMAALYQFAMDDGRGVFIIGGTAQSNKITTPLGMMLVEDILEDEVNQVVDKSTGVRIADKTTFSIDLPITRQDVVVNTFTRNVNSVNVFGVNGIYLFGNAHGVIFSGDSANTPKLLGFPKGSNPPIAAYVKVGRGMLFFLSDPDMLINKNVDNAKYRSENIKLATNAVDVLAAYTSENKTEDEFDDIIMSLKVEIKNMNASIMGLEGEKTGLGAQVSSLSSEKSMLSDRLMKAQENKFMGLDYLIWAILGAGILIAVSLFFAMQKKKPKGKKQGGEGSELGYEFDTKTGGSGEFSDEDMKLSGEVKEEDIEQRLKELEKKGSG